MALENRVLFTKNVDRWSFYHGFCYLGIIISLIVVNTYKTRMKMDGDMSMPYYALRYGVRIFSWQEGQDCFKWKMKNFEQNPCHIVWYYWLLLLFLNVISTTYVFTHKCNNFVWEKISLQEEQIPPLRARLCQGA